ncbi:phospholipase [Maribius pontilimi]|uniref:Phospholipase D n=1 Tax=Palleronia pontilimi TaxID=1964209 RepID=A0A934IF57_9RHOB|nr:phospholipase D-like domain-containing protein [Palleronia pontilimi]MBJ3761621.1 phospholipase [Palleronia pontilimi]
MRDTRSTFRLLLTAEEAYPAFERAVLAAQDRIVMGFRVFDPVTRLRSDEAREIGDDWVDLLVHLLKRGVRIDLTLSDFDAIGSPEMHGLTWSSLRKMAAVAELAGDAGHRLSARAALHPARVGWMTGTLLWPRVRSELREITDGLNALDPEMRRQRMRDLPGLRRWLTEDDGGKIVQTQGGPFPLHPVSHHQKLAVVDGKTLYIGGLDLNPRRYDTTRHHRPSEETWHDVQLIAEGPVAAHAEAHLRAFVAVTHGQAEPAAEGDGLRLTLTRARPAQRVNFGPQRLLSGLNDTLIERIGAATRTLYFETQFFRDVALARAVAAAGRAQPDLQALFILPAAPEDVAFERRNKADARFGEYLQARCVKLVCKAFGDRVFFASPVQPRSADFGDADQRDKFGGAPLIYVHAKVAVFDAESALVSSANMNGRSLHWDTEAGLICDDPGFAAEVQQRALGHWAYKRHYDPDAPLVAQVRAWADEDWHRQPENREGYLLPYDVSPARRFGMPLPGVPAEMV